MASRGSEGLKRRASRDSISPPALKKKQPPKIQSNTTQSAVASFFTPTSQKPPEKVSWQERAVNDDSPNTLLVGRCAPDGTGLNSAGTEKGRKIAAFDFDSTLITTLSGKKFATNASDWKWWHLSVPKTLKKLHDDGYLVVVVSNQAGLALKPDPKIAKAQQTKLAAFKSKAGIVMSQLDMPISIYAATEKDNFRKPRTGMWEELLDDHDLKTPGSVDLEASFFVGDAGGRLAEGRTPKDFSCSDRNFAENIGIRFLTPEEFFLEESPRPFLRSFEPSKFMIAAENTPDVKPLSVTKQNEKDIILFCGSPGAGKSTTYWKHLKPLGYERVNQDILKTRDRCIKTAEEHLLNGASVAIDSTNADQDTRSKWVDLAKKHNVPIRCLLFTADEKLCEHNDVVRALNMTMNPEKRTILPGMAFRSFTSRYQRPQLSEGFQDIVEVAFQFNGTDAERAIWARYWT